MISRTVVLKSVNGKTFEAGQLAYGLLKSSLVALPDEKAFECIKSSIDGGSNVLSGATFYGTKDPHFCLKLLGRFFKAHPDYADRCFVSIKGGLTWPAREPDSSETLLRKEVEVIKATLGPHKRLDFYSIARVDKRYPIEETMNILKQLVHEGHFDYIGLSECGADTIRRAESVSPQALLSYWSTDIEKNGTLRTCSELNIPILAYSPLGHGMFATDFDPATLPKDDYRRGRFDRFNDENLESNYEYAAHFKEIAARCKISPVQMALAWLMQQTTAIIMPVPGSSRPEGVKEALASLKVTLDKETMQEIRALVDAKQIKGLRYWPDMERQLNLDTPAL